MGKFNYYLKIDPETKNIIDILEDLESVVSERVSGLEYSSPDRLEDLRWAGCNYGIIQINERKKSLLNNYSSEGCDLNPFKSKLIKKLNNKKMIHLQNGITINGQYSMPLRDNDLVFLTMKYLYCLHNQNLEIDYYFQSTTNKLTISSKKFILLYEKIIDFIDDCSKIEIDYCKKIKSTNKILTLFLINFDNIEWRNREIDV